MQEPAPTKKKSNAEEFVLTDIGEGIVEVEVLKWFVKPGDHVKAFDKLLEVQSDKATVEITSRHDGIVKALGVKEKEMAKVGQVLVYFENNNNHTSNNTTTTIPNEHVASQEKVLSTPAVRHLAREHGIDLSRIKGTGKDGRVMKSDVLAFLKPQQEEEPSKVETQAAPVDLPTELPPIERRNATTIPISGIRREMAKAMTASLQIPHMNLMEEVEVDAVHELASQVKGQVSMLSIFIKCTSLALLDYPQLNAAVNAEVTELNVFPHHNIGIALDTANGLMVPVIPNVELKSVFEITEVLNRFKHSQGKLPRSDLVGATISLSNIGSLGGSYATPLIAPPQVAIGAFGRAKRTPVFTSATSMDVKQARIMPVSWAADHRVLDGATLARFSNRFKQLVENPMQLMMRLR